MRLVLDTNVVVSAFINPAGNPSQILKMVLGRRVELCYNAAILGEYESVMRRPKFSGKIDLLKTNQFINLIRVIGISFNPFSSRIKLPDESDRIFYDTAKGSGSILISGNIRHYPKRPFIMPPANFIKLIGDDKPSL